MDNSQPLREHTERPMGFFELVFLSELIVAKDKSTATLLTFKT